MTPSFAPARAHGSHLRASNDEAALIASERHASIVADADARTLPAREAIRRLGQISQREAFNLLSAVAQRIADSYWAHTPAATQAQESISDATAVTERAAENSEEMS